MGATRWSEAHSARAHAILGETPRMTHPMTHTRARPHRSSVFVNVQREKDLARVRASLRTGPRATFQFRTESIRARLRKYGPPTAAQPPQPSRPTPAPPSPAQPNPTNLRRTRSRQAANLTTPWGGGGRGGVTLTTSRALPPPGTLVVMKSCSRGTPVCWMALATAAWLK